MCLPAVAMAQTDIITRDVPKFNMQRWRPAPMPSDYLTTYGTMIEDDWRLTGGFYLNYAHMPMDISHGSSATPLGVISNQLYLDLYLSIALFSYVELAVVMPFALYETTDFTEARYPLSKADGASGVGDLRFVLKGKLLDMRKYPVGLALIADLSTPTGTKGKFMSDEGVTFSFQAALEWNPWTKARMGVNLGYRYRPVRDIYGYTMGQSILISGAASIPLFIEDLDLLLDLAGEITVESSNKRLDAIERPFEAEIGIRYRFIRGDRWWRGLAMTAAVGSGINAIGVPDIRAILGLNFHWVNGGKLDLEYDFGGFLTAIEPCPDPELTPYSQIPERCRNISIDSDGDTIPDKLDKCPFSGRVGFIDENGCPPDSDGDTIPDYEDLCPTEGGTVDKYGCPYKDSDGDTILDNVDKCPHDPETFNGYQDQDGCPDSDPDALVELSGNKINIKEQVFFETSKDVIKKESYKLLDQVSKLLIENPHVGNITIEGHTDSRGKHSYNVKLSQARANSVMKYLIDKGVDNNRLKAIGFGPDNPIDDNETEDGRARNRRVEFVVIGLPDDSKTR